VRFAWLLLLAVCAPQFYCVAEAFRVPAAERLNLTPHMEVLEGDSEGMTLEEVLRVPEEHFRQLDAQALNEGLGSRIVWMRVTLQADDRTLRRLLLFDNPRLNSVSLYEQDDNGLWQVRSAGTDHPFYSREVLHPQAAFMITIPPGATRTLYVRVSHSGSFRFSVELYRVLSFHHYVARWTAYTFLLIGALCAIGIYNLFIFIGLRERGYLFLAIFIGLYLLFQTSLNGVAHMYLWPNSPWWSDHCITFFVMLTVVAAVVFSIEVLNARQLAPWLAKLASILGGVAFLTALLALTDWQGKYVLSHVLGLVMPVLIMLLAIRSWRKGYRPAGYYIVAWTVGLAGSAMLSLLGPGLIPTNLLTEHLAEVGFLAAIFLWSFTLSHRVSEKEEAQRATLERLVKERTAELEQSMADLRTLQGLLPICSSCKKIRDDSGYWNEVEEYFARHTGADFSHGLCPECALRLYPQFFTRKDV